MSTRVVYFGPDNGEVLTTLRGDGCEVYNAGSSIEQLSSTIQDHQPEVLVVNEFPGVTPGNILPSVVHERPAMARVLFHEQPSQLDPTLFDLAIPVACPPLQWLPRLKSLIERSSVLRSEQATLSSKSRLLRAESVRARRESKRARAQKVQEIERYQRQGESFRRYWADQQQPLPEERSDGWARTLVIDDHHAFRERLVDLLSEHVPTNVIGEAADGFEALRMAEELQPDLVLLDIELPKLNGFAIARQLRRTLPAAKIIFVTANSDTECVAAAFDLGAEGFVLKTDVVRSLKRAIDTVLRGHRYVSS